MNHGLIERLAGFVPAGIDAFQRFSRRLPARGKARRLTQFKLAALTFAWLAACVQLADAQGTAFTYQGRLNEGTNPANGFYDLRFRLYDAATFGAQFGSAVNATAVAVTNGLFTVPLDFGLQFPGADRWLEISVRTNGAASFVPLSPRQQVTPTPYAITAGSVVSGGLAAGSYGNAVTLNNAANQFTGSFTGNGANVTNVNAASLGGFAASNYWRLTGNSVATNQFLGSTNNVDVELRANNEPVLRLSYRSNALHGIAPTVIGGHKANNASVSFQGQVIPVYVGVTIGGGGSASAPNLVQADMATVAGGFGNLAIGTASVISGGTNNYAAGKAAAVLGGEDNQAKGAGSAVLGGRNNVADNEYSLAGGNGAQTAGAAAFALGKNVSAGGNYARALGIYCTAAGHAGTAMGDLCNATGEYSIALGHESSATALSTCALGHNANAIHSGAFVWADTDGFGGPNLAFNSAGTNTFNIRARGGVWLDDGTNSTDLYFGSNARQMINLFNQQYAIGVQSSTTYFRSNARFSWFKFGVHSDTQNDPGAGGSVLMTLTSSGLTVNGTFVSASDRNVKEDFQPVDSQAVLEKVVALPLSQWRYKSDEERSRHLGPMAQDFKAAFNLGADDKHIATVDADGVALAAIQGLNQKLERENAELRTRLERLEKLMAERR